MLRASDDDDDVDDDGDDDDDECRGPDLAQNADTHTHTLGASLHSRNSCLHVTGDIRRATLYRNLQEKCRGPQIGPRTRTHTLCERAQAKCMSRFHKSHFRRKFTGKMPQTKLSPERGRTLCASLRNRNACLHVTRVIRRATEIYRKNAAAQIGSRTRKDTLCKPAQSKCISTCHKRHQKSHFIWKISGKMPGPTDWAQNVDTRFVRACAVETNVKISQEPFYRGICR